MPSAIVAVEKCSKCDGTLDTQDTKAKDHWCRKCRAEYQRDYQDRKYEEAKAEGFAEGVKCIKNALIVAFGRYPMGQFNGLDCARYIHGFEMPAISCEK